MSNRTASSCSFFAENLRPVCIYSSVRYSMAWARISCACIACGVMQRRRLGRTRAVETACVDAGIKKPVVVIAAMVLSSLCSSAPMDNFLDYERTVSRERTVNDYVPYRELTGRHAFCGAKMDQEKIRSQRLIKPRNYLQFASS